VTERDALTAAVLADPAADLPRLVFADWCDDHGEPDRAEFVRVQVALAHLPAGDPSRVGLKARERELLTPDNRVRWGVPGFSGRQEFRRGFVEGVRAAAAPFVALGDRLFELAPVREVRLSVLDNLVPAICRVAGLAVVHTFDLSGNYLGFGDRLDRLLADTRLDNLRSLILRDNRMFADSVPRVASTAVAQQLTSLNLSGNPLADAGLEALAGTRRLGELRSLTVRNDEQIYEDSVHAAGAAALAAAEGFSRLERLDLSGHRIGDAGFASLVESPLFPRLTVLRLARNDIGEVGDEWADRLTRSRASSLPRLIDLSGRRNAIGPLAAAALAGWDRLAGVTIDLRGCSMSAESYARLKASAHAGRLLMDPEPPVDEDSP
jgi:uncharacterized protein (TIGR02996 family)